MIDEMEGREVSTPYITGAFLQTDYDKGDIHIKLEGDISTLLEYINPEYYKYFFTQINAEGNARMKNPRRMSMEH